MQRYVPDYMLPRAFVELDSLPVTPNGKLDRAALPAPDFDRRSGSAYQAPRNPIEAHIVDVWSQLLERSDFGVDDDFFVLGGHSLLALRAIAKLQERYDVDIPLAALFREPTAAALASHIETILSDKQAFLDKDESEIAGLLLQLQ